NLRELVSSSALLSNMSYAAFSFHQLLHLIGSPTPCAVALELTLFNVMFQEHFGAKSVRDFRKPIIAHAVLDVVIVSVDISHGEERIVTSTLRGIADSQYSIRLLRRQLIVPPQLVLLIEQALTFNRLVHKERSPRHLIQRSFHV